MSKHTLFVASSFVITVSLYASGERDHVVYDPHANQFTHIPPTKPFEYEISDGVHEACKETFIGFAKELGRQKTVIEDVQRIQLQTNPYQTSIATELCSYMTVFTGTQLLCTLKTTIPWYQKGTALFATAMCHLSPYGIPLAISAWGVKIAYDYFHTKKGIAPMRALGAVLSHNFHAFGFAVRNMACLMFAVSIAGLVTPSPHLS